MTEKWIKAFLHEDKYEVSSLGKIREINSKRLCKQYLDNFGYWTISIEMQGEDLVEVPVHKIVYQSFHKGLFMPTSWYPKEKYSIHHTDGNKSNNKLNNLVLLDNETHKLIHETVALMSKYNNKITVKEVTNRILKNKNISIECNICCCRREIAKTKPNTAEIKKR